MIDLVFRVWSRLMTILPNLKASNAISCHISLKYMSRCCFPENCINRLQKYFVPVLHLRGLLKARQNNTSNCRLAHMLWTSATEGRDLNDTYIVSSSLDKVRSFTHTNSIHVLLNRDDSSQSPSKSQTPNCGPQPMCVGIGHRA